MVRRRRQLEDEVSDLVRTRLAHLIAEQRPTGTRAVDLADRPSVLDTASGRNQLPRRAAPATPSYRAIAASSPPLEDPDPAVGWSPVDSFDSEERGLHEGQGAQEGLGVQEGGGVQEDTGVKEEGGVQEDTGVNEEGGTKEGPGTQDEKVDQQGQAKPTAATALNVPPTRRRFTRVHLSMVIGVLLVALVGAGWAMLRARPVALATVTTTAGGGADAGSAPNGAPSTSAIPHSASGSGSPAGSSGSVAPPSPAPTIVVHLLGAVRTPGVVSLPDPSRVEDAIEASGGLRKDADAAELNLAQLLTDGQQIVIGTQDDPGGELRGQHDPGSSTTTGPGGKTAGPSALVNLNTATVAEFETLPGVGPVTAGKIVTWRDANERFSRVDELQEVDGIGPKTYAELAPLVTV